MAHLDPKLREYKDMKLTKKAVAHILTGAVLAIASTHASAINVTSNNETFTATGTITDALGNTAAIGSSMDNIGGTDGQGRNIATGHIMSVGAGQTAVYHDYTTVKSWADLAIDLGWMHSVDWVQVNVAQSGNYQIRSEILGVRNAQLANNATYSSTVIDTSLHPAFSIWSMASSTFTSSGSSNNPTSVQSPLAYGYTTGGNNNTMGFNQVAAPNGTNNATFLGNGGVNGFVGYSNSGFSGWYNGNGDYVASGSAGASNGTAGSGFLYTDLTTYLAQGSYLIAMGGSCVNLQDCGPYRDSLTGGAKSWGTGWHELTVTSVPVPGAVWLFGSALMGFVGLGRRKAIAA